MSQDMRGMREDAIRRARDMYARYVPQRFEQSFADEEDIKTVEESKENVIEHLENNTNSNNSNTEQTQDLLKELFKDKDKMLIIALIVILSQESKDNTVLFALMYLLI